MKHHVEDNLIRELAFAHSERRKVTPEEAFAAVAERQRELAAKEEQERIFLEAETERLKKTYILVLQRRCPEAASENGIFSISVSQNVIDEMPLDISELERTKDIEARLEEILQPLFDAGVITFPCQVTARA
jgi:hypothetical protein